MLALAEIRAGSGGSKEEVAGLIDKAIKTAPNEVEPRLALVRHYMRSGDPKQAASVAQDALNALPGRADLYDALGQAQQAAGNANEALVAYGRYAEVAPDSPVPYVRMATLHLRARDFSAAADSFRRALAIKPDFVDAQKGLAAIDLGQNKVADAAADRARTCKSNGRRNRWASRSRETSTPRATSGRKRSPPIARR